MQCLSSAWKTEWKAARRPVCKCKDNTSPHPFASFFTKIFLKINGKRVNLHQ